MIIGIVAISKNFAIGRGGKLPWHYSADLKFFKETTMGGAVVMGSRTWESIGRPLPGRFNVVLSRSGRVETPPQVMRLRSIEEVIELAKYLNRDVFIIGGAATYAEFADVIDRWIVTEIPETIEDADTFMPRDFLDGFNETEKRELGDGLRVKIFQR
ncbi:MAG: dihydrofolate reductase [Acidobacteriota bacterium]|nr:MAG: dihydrofolate reductase [Acidobacteriota bacterium]